MIISPIKNNLIFASNKKIQLKQTDSSEPSHRLIDNSGRLNECYRNYFISRSKDSSRYNFFKFIYGDGRLKKSDFDLLDEKTKNEVTKLAWDYVDKHYKTRYKVTPETFVLSAEILKNNFDKTYGKDNYRIISLGTSPSITAQAMEYLGADVMYIPISGIHEDGKRYDSAEDIERFRSKTNVKLLMSYLDSLGMKNDDKINLVMDFTISSRTLDVTKRCIQAHFNLDDDKIKEIDLIEQLSQANKNLGFIMDEGTIINFSNTIVYQEVENFCPVPHFYVNERDNVLSINPVHSALSSQQSVFNQINNYSTPLSKVFSICMLSLIENKHKKNPKDEPQD